MGIEPQIAILSSLLANHQSRHQAAIKWAVSLVLADGHFNLPQGLCVGMHGLTYSLYHTVGYSQRSQEFSHLLFEILKSMRWHSVCNRAPNACKFHPELQQMKTAKWFHTIVVWLKYVFIKALMSHNCTKSLQL